MAHAYEINQDVHLRARGPQGRVIIEAPKVYTVVQLRPVEADGTVKYHLKSKLENIERIASEDELFLLLTTDDAPTRPVLCNGTK